MKTILKSIYNSPEVEIVELRVEQGFAVSVEDWYNNDPIEGDEYNEW